MTGGDCLGEIVWYDKITIVLKHSCSTPLGGKVNVV